MTTVHTPYVKRTPRNSTLCFKLQVVDAIENRLHELQTSPSNLCYSRAFNGFNLTKKIWKNGLDT